jgi:polysaccharide biosynthesis transport protein
VRGKYLVLLTTLVVVGGAVLWSYFQDNVYQAQARILVQARGTGAILGGTNSSSGDSQRNIANELIVLDSQDLRQTVVQKLGHQPKVAFGNVTNTDVITVSTEGEEPKQVAADANAYVETYIDQRRADSTASLQAQQLSLQNQITALNGQLAWLDPISDSARQISNQIITAQSTLNSVTAALGNPDLGVGAKQIAFADVPTSPTSPKPLKNALAALGIGLVLGIGLAFLRDDGARPR